jgi:medium-chain acyl-[acyl-carrier-protein] hydrolase
LEGARLAVHSLGDTNGSPDSVECRKWISSLPARRGSPVQLRLICLPYAGGGASIFNGWQDEIPSGVEVCPVQLPGREGRWNEPAFTDMHALVSLLSRVLRPLLDVPFALFGHSMGALISFELIRQWRRDGAALPERLFASGARAPHLRPDVRIHDLPDALFMKRLVAFKGIAEEVLRNRELLEVVMPTIRADFAVCETYAYRPENPVPCAISAYGGQQDRMVQQGHLAAWRRHTQTAFGARIFPGAHFFLFTERRQFMRELSAELTRILAGISNGPGVRVAL